MLTVRKIGNKSQLHVIIELIYNDVLKLEKLIRGNRGLIRSLRHRGRTRYSKGHQEKRGPIRFMNARKRRPTPRIWTLGSRYRSLKNYQNSSAIK